MQNVSSPVSSSATSLSSISSGSQDNRQRITAASGWCWLRSQRSFLATMTAVVNISLPVLEHEMAASLRLLNGCIAYCLL
jgi:hypothetical protein